MKQQYDERNRDLVIGIDDTLVHRDQAGISPFDSVVQGGDAVWEGPAAARRPDLQAHRAPGAAAAVGPGAGVHERAR
jgi:hypothetical protein